MEEDIKYRNYILQKVQSSLSLCYETSYCEEPSINVDNIAPLLASLGIHQGETELLDLTRNALIETNGEINSKDLDKALTSIAIQNGDHEEMYFEEAFAILDLDNDGYISAGDIYRLFQKLNIKATDEGLFNIINNIDYDHDGKIDFEDFRKLLLGIEPVIIEEPPCPDIEHKDDDDNGHSHDKKESSLDIASLRDRRPSLRKLTKDDGKFHLVSENRRNLFSYAGYVKETASVVSFLRRLSQVEVPNIPGQQQENKIGLEEDKFDPEFEINSPPPKRRRSSCCSDIFIKSPRSVDSQKRLSYTSDLDLESPERPFISPRITKVNLSPRIISRKLSLGSSSSDLISNEASLSCVRLTEMRQTVTDTVMDDGEKPPGSPCIIKVEADTEEDSDVLCLKDLRLTLGDNDGPLNNTESELSVSQTVNGLVEKANEMVSRLIAGAAREMSPTLQLSSIEEPMDQSWPTDNMGGKRQRSLDIAGEYKDAAQKLDSDGTKDATQKLISGENFDPDDMSSATRNNLFEFHKITSPSLSQDALSQDVVQNTSQPEPQNVEQTSTEIAKISKSGILKNKQVDIKPFFTSPTVTSKKFTSRQRHPFGNPAAKISESDEEDEDGVFVSLVEQYHRPQRRINRRRTTSDNRSSIGKCLKVRTLKKTKPSARTRKDKNVTPTIDPQKTEEIRVPTGEPEIDPEKEAKLLREERLRNFNSGGKKSGYVKIDNFEIPISESPRIPSFPTPRRRLSGSLSARPQTARPIRISYPQEFIVGDSVTSKHLSNSHNGTFSCIEDMNTKDSGYIEGHVTYESNPSINGMQPLKVRKDSAPGISTWQHDFPTVSKGTYRPKTAIGMGRSALYNNNKITQRPFTARYHKVNQDSDNVVRNSVIGSTNEPSLHTETDSSSQFRFDSNTSSRRARCGDSTGSSVADDSSEEVSELSNPLADKPRNASNQEVNCENCDPNSIELQNTTLFCENCTECLKEKTLLDTHQGVSNVHLTPTPPKSPNKRRPQTAKPQTIYLTQRSYPLGSRDEPLDTNSTNHNIRPHTARRSDNHLYKTQKSYPLGANEEIRNTIENNRPQTALPLTNRSDAPSSMRLNIVNMSPRSPKTRPKTATIRCRNGSNRLSESTNNPVLPDPSPRQQVTNLETVKVITDSFPGSTVRRRRSVAGSPALKQPPGEDNPVSSQVLNRYIYDCDETASLNSSSESELSSSLRATGSATGSTLRRPKSSVGTGFNKTSRRVSEVSVVDMSEALNTDGDSLKTGRKCRFKPLSRAIIALNRTKRIVTENGSISRSLETKSILLQHDDLSKPKIVSKPENRQSDKNLIKTKTIITLEIPQA